MVECGTIDQPPNIHNLTIWGIVTFVIMLVLGVGSIYGVMDSLRMNDFWAIIGIVGNGFGVAGLIFVLLSIFQNNPVHMKIGVFCFLISCIINIVVFIIFIIRDKGLYYGGLLTLLLDIFLCYLFYRQSNGFTPST